MPSSPGKDSQPFDFGSGSKKGRLLMPPSIDDPMDDYLYTPSRSLSQGMGSDYIPVGRPRASTISTGASINAQALPTVFRWDGGGKQVFISGTFNSWKTKIPMVKSQEKFTTIVELPEGQHQYKYCVDGEWVHDPKEPTTNNDVGSVNNTITVKKADFEVFEALAMDSTKEANSKQISGSPPGEYSQEIPIRNPQEKSSGPPILPPHLLQVILNKDTSLQCEPSLLPEPNHVMLNHLYALSIKDGVMVLSATHRYRKKYTTLLYKPI